jgi:hypothetical protein
VLQNSLKFTFLYSQIFYNFLGIFGIFPIISVTRISLFIFLNLEINFKWISFFFYFLAQPARPPTPSALACRLAQATQPTSPLLGQPAQRPPSLPDHRALLAFVHLRLSSEAEPHRLPACAATALEQPWPPLLRCKTPPPSTIKPQLLPPPP